MSGSKVSSKEGYALLDVEAGFGRQATDDRTPLLQETPYSREETVNAGDLDIVQFSSPSYYVHENKEVAVAVAMRHGALSEECTVEFKTKDNSAKAGDKYIAMEGTVKFRPHEELKRIEIPILSNDAFDTNLEFTLLLQNPKRCILGKEVKQCSIMIIDDDFFPANEFREYAEKDELHTVGLRMLWSFIVFSIRRVPLVGWRTYWTLMLDQAHNVYYLFQIWLQIYLVDVVFKKGPETDEKLWVRGQREWTTVLVALCYTLPKVVLSMIDYSKEGSLRVPGKVRQHLMVNIFRKYLNYSEKSYTKVSPQYLVAAMGSNADDLVGNGFMVIFKMAKQLMKGCVILYFLIKKQPSSALPLLVYPIASFFVLHVRYKKTLELQDAAGLADIHISECIEDAYQHIDLVKEYNMRHETVSAFEKTLKAASPHNRAYREYDFKTLLVMPWITNLAIACYTIVGGCAVLHDVETLGTYLATISIYKDAGEIFGEFYEHFKNCYTVISPLLTVIGVINLETDVEMRIKQATQRSQTMQDQLKDLEAEADSSTKSRFDRLPIGLRSVSMYTDGGGGTEESQNISVSIPQGKLVAVLGPQSTGKFSLLRVLRGSLMPSGGEVHLPTHLRCICVPRIPQFCARNVLDNLKFGTKGEVETSRLMHICKRMQLNEKSMKLIEYHIQGDEENGIEAPDKDEKNWIHHLSHSELLKLHIARALYYNPEVLLLQRPVDEMEADHAANILGVLRDFVEKNGNLESPFKNESARPRTVFFTSGQDRERAETAADVADVVWRLSESGGIKVEDGGGKSRAKSVKIEGNRILKSWSRQAQHNQQQFEQERHRHATTIEKSEKQEGELQHLVYQLGAWEQEVEGQEWGLYDDPNSAKNRLKTMHKSLAEKPKPGNSSRQASRESKEEVATQSWLGSWIQ